MYHRNDKATLKKVACHEQLEHALKILKDRDPNWVYKWKFHRVVGANSQLSGLRLFP